MVRSGRVGETPYREAILIDAESKLASALIAERLPSRTRVRQEAES